MDQKIIGAFIAERRRTRGLTQRELADKLNIRISIHQKYSTNNWGLEIGYIQIKCKATRNYEIHDRRQKHNFKYLK